MSLPFDFVFSLAIANITDRIWQKYTLLPLKSLDVWPQKHLPPSLGTIILVCTVVAAALKVGTMRELSAKPQKMPHGETKQTIVEHQSSYLEQCLDGFPWWPLYLCCSIKTWRPQLKLNLAWAKIVADVNCKNSWSCIWADPLLSAAVPSQRTYLSYIEHTGPSVQQSVPWTSTLLHDCGITESNAGKLAQIISKTNKERQTWATIEKKPICNNWKSFQLI